MKYIICGPQRKNVMNLASATQSGSGLEFENKFFWPENNLLTYTLYSLTIMTRFPQDGMVSFFRNKKSCLEQFFNSNDASSTSLPSPHFSVPWAALYKTVGTGCQCCPSHLYLSWRSHFHFPLLVNLTCDWNSRTFGFWIGRCMRRMPQQKPFKSRNEWHPSSQLHLLAQKPVRGSWSISMGYYYCCCHNFYYYYYYYYHQAAG